MASDELADLRNFGPKSANLLRLAGIQSRSQIDSLGPAATFLMVARIEPVSLNFLWAVAAMLQDKDWRDLTEPEKNALKKKLSDMKR